MRVTTVLFGLVLLVAGCGTFPRGSALQSEVLEQATADPVIAADGTEIAAPAEFAVETVTRDKLGIYADWPAVGERDLPWIERVDQPNNRIIAPGDTVAVSIWSTEDNGLLTIPGQRFVALPPIRVSPGGEIFLPYIGQIRISGMAPETARAKIEEAYLDVTPSAQVQLELTEGRQSTVSLIEGFAAPSVYPLVDQDVTLLEMIAQAGGIAPGLRNPQVRLQRGDRTYGISAARLLSDTDLNTTLQGGDRVFAQADDRYFLSLGASRVSAQVPFAQDRITALEAMALIGGLAPERANAQGILILRRYREDAVRTDDSGPHHARTIFTIDLTSADGLFSAGQFRIRPGDLIYVTESPLLTARNIFGLIGTVFGLGVQIGNQVSG
jgi:polysaccharide biosynthesis/export protein